MKTDVQIAQECVMEPILRVAEKMGLSEDELELYGKHKAKIHLSALESRRAKKDGKLILVTAINPTPAGEGKTTVNIGLSMALNRIGKNAVSALRELSLGPSFGIKGGVAGIFDLTSTSVRVEIQKYLVQKGDEEVLMLLRREQVLEETIAQPIQTYRLVPVVRHVALLRRFYPERLFRIIAPIPRHGTAANALFKAP